MNKADKIKIEPIKLLRVLAANYKGRLDPVAVLIALNLYAHSGWTGSKKFHLSEQKLANWSMTSKATISRQKQQLKEHGLISWSQGSYKGNKGTDNTYDIEGLCAVVERYNQEHPHQNDNGLDSDLSQNDNGTHRQNDNGPFSKCKSIENRKRIIKENLSRGDDDMTGEEASKCFSQATDFLSYIRSLDWGADTSELPDNRICGYFENVKAKDWKLAGKPIKSIKATLCNPASHDIACKIMQPEPPIPFTVF